MRVVSFTDHLELDFEGNVLKNSILLGDVDNDGLSELVVGNDKGELSVFKGESGKPLCSAKVTGVITAVAVGDVLNIGKNVLFTVTACGHCNLYDIDKECEELGKKPLIPFHTQRIPANIKVAYIGDINGDGFSEVIVGLTDRVVRTFRWVSACQTVKDKIVGKLVGLNKWEFAEQIGTIALHKSNDGKPCIIVAQPSGTFITLQPNSFQEESSVEHLDESIGEFLTKISINLEPLASAKLRNSEICGNIVNKFDDLSSGPSLAIATLDGILMLVRNGKILWKQSLDHELFAVSCVDWTRDGNEEIAACAWDGNTFVVNHNNEGIQFSFHEPVNAFVAGMYGIKKQETPCLVYVTFNGKIYLYYDVSVPYIIPKSLIQILKENKEYIEYAESLGIDINDKNELRKLNKSLLYEF